MVCIIALCSLVLAPVYADVSSIKNTIDQRNQDILNIQKEIEAYQTQINALTNQASSLSSAVKALELTRKKLAADVHLTQDKIANKNAEIQQLSTDIDAHTRNIEDDRRVVARTLSAMNEHGSISITDALLGANSISSLLDTIEGLATVQNNVIAKIGKIAQDKANLESTKTRTEKAKADLVALNNQLSDQQSIVVSTQNQQNQLLKETRQSEVQYQNLLAQKKRQKDAFEQEVQSLESQLKTAVDSSKLPKFGGVLAWPLDTVHVTQFFGNTDFSTKNPQIYNGSGHTGIDLRATIGTPVHSALSGVVVGMGNTDLIPTCYSYGKWIMVRHDNGLSTLYGHLSLQVVTTGTAVSTGQFIGYSGNTGYSTGPHLHFGVYASQGVQIQPLSSSKNCHNVIIPIAPFSAYLNPLTYLPSL